MTLNFKNLNNTMLHSLCSDLVKVEFANTACIEGAAGDEGIDRFIGNDINENTLHAFQHKFFTKPLILLLTYLIGAILN
jgi:hypothetical protein